MCIIALTVFIAPTASRVTEPATCCQLFSCAYRKDGCICNRPTASIVCYFCGSRFSNSRVRMECVRHPKVLSQLWFYLRYLTLLSGRLSTPETSPSVPHANTTCWGNSHPRLLNWQSLAPPKLPKSPARGFVLTEVSFSSCFQISSCFKFFFQPRLIAMFLNQDVNYRV